MNDRIVVATIAVICGLIAWWLGSSFVGIKTAALWIVSIVGVICLCMATFPRGD